MTVHSRFAIGALMCTLMILCFTVRGETLTAQGHASLVAYRRIQQSLPISEAYLVQLSQTGFRLRGIADWWISTISSNLAEDRKISILGNSGNYDIALLVAPREPDFCFWNAQSFPASKQLMIHLYGNPRIGGRPFGPGFQFGWQIAIQEDMEEDFSRTRGKADVLSIPWGPWILQ